MNVPVKDMQLYDVIVIGGGPAGSTAVALLAQRSRLLYWALDQKPKPEQGDK